MQLSTLIERNFLNLLISFTTNIKLCGQKSLSTLLRISKLSITWNFKCILEGKFILWIDEQKMLRVIFKRLPYMKVSLVVKTRIMSLVTIVECQGQNRLTFHETEFNVNSLKYWTIKKTDISFTVSWLKWVGNRERHCSMYENTRWAMQKSIFYTLSVNGYSQKLVHLNIPLIHVTVLLDQSVCISGSFNTT